jgi:hypothetical protein
VTLAARFGDYQGAQRRVERLILILGVCGIAIAGVRWGLRAGLGFAAGAGLAWINYRWLKHGVKAILPAPEAVPAPQTEKEAGASMSAAGTPKVPVAAFAKFFGRYILLGVALYVILAYSLVPAAAFLAGLFVGVAAVLAEFSYELLRNKS